MKTKLANSNIVIFNMCLIKFFACCSPFSVSGDVEEVGCVIGGKFGCSFDVFAYAPYLKCLLVVGWSAWLNILVLWFL